MPRADAARNRSLLVDAARVELAEHGLDVSIARIAARAGVAKGTLFNHFASKEELVAAIVCDQLAGLAAASEALLTHHDPHTALLDFMTAGAELTASDRSFCDAVAVTSRDHPAVRDASDRLAETAEALTARARTAGTIRPDITGRDIVLLLNAPTQIAGPVAAARPDLWRRYLHLVVDGLRPAGARELSVAPPTSQDFSGASAS